MKKFWKTLLTTSLVVPCAFSLTGCGKEMPEEPTMETWDGTISDVSEQVDGVITIETAEELAGVAKKVNEGTSYKGITIKLTVDMDLNSKEWTPIGYGTSNGLGVIESGKPFEGTFDGNNHTIYNLKITTFSNGGLGNENASSGVAFIGHNRGTIKNLTIDNATVEGNHYVAAISGFGIDATITNCHVKNANINAKYSNSDESGDKAGAVIAYLSTGLLEESNASITNSSAKDSIVKADRDAGQVIGCLAGNATQTGNSANNVSVSWNESGNTANKSNTNISNDIVGRVA